MGRTGHAVQVASGSGLGDVTHMPCQRAMVCLEHPAQHTGLAMWIEFTQPFNRLRVQRLGAHACGSGRRVRADRDLDGLALYESHRHFLSAEPPAGTRARRVRPLPVGRHRMPQACDPTPAFVNAALHEALAPLQRASCPGIGRCQDILSQAGVSRPLRTMRRMHPYTAWRRVGRLASPGGSWALATVAWPAAAAAAADPATSTGSGVWLFATVAFVGVGVASFAAGWWRARGQGQDGQPGSNRPGTPASRRPAVLGGDSVANVQAGRHSASTGPTANVAPSAQLLRQQAALLTADPRPLLLLEQPPAAAERCLLQANAVALQQMGLTANALGQPWSTLEAAAPATLRTALADPGNPGGWWLLRDEAAGLTLALGPDSSSAESDTASLVYTVSHDLRAPIRVVEGFTRIVKEDYGRQLDRVGNDHLDRVLAAGARMNQMIDAVLQMARLASQPLVRQPVDLSQLAGFVLDDLRRGAPERVVDLAIEPGLKARGDPTLLRLVLENLLGNAWKYSGQNPQARIEFGATTGDGRRVYTVRDNGAGFDMRVADRLFGLFQRLHSAKDFPGTGVGLASVRRIVQRHGGEIWAEADVDRGARFHFTLA